MMLLHHEIIALLYYPVKAFKVVFRNFFNKKSPRLRVLIYHDIAPHEQKKFATQLRYLSKYWSFMTPKQFEAIVSGEEQIYDDSLLLTFDDGFVSNKHVAKKILNPMGIKALFFVMPDFINIKSKRHARKFIAKNICPGKSEDQIPSYCYNMNWEDIKFLIKTGHTIGAHTLKHSKLSEITDSLELEKEILHGVSILEDKLEVTIQHFAFPFGNILHFSQMALGLAKARFQYIYTAMRGNNINVPFWCIRRDALTPLYHFSLIDAFLEGFADFHYKKGFSKISKWMDED